MQVQGVNTINNNYNTNFKAIKELRYKNLFNPHASADHANVVREFLNSDAIQKFAKECDCIAEFDVQAQNKKCNKPHHYIFKFLQSLNKKYNQQYHYILKFLPYTAETTEKSGKTVKNLPLEFTVLHCEKQNEHEANKTFSHSLEKLEYVDIRFQLACALKEKNQLQKEEKKIETPLSKLHEKFGFFDTETIVSKRLKELDITERYV